MNAIDLFPESPCRTLLVPPATLAEARTGRDALALLLGRERAAAADFLLALADFDRRRGWERLGHASLFAFLTRELALSRGGAYFRLTAARLAQRFPEVIEPLRDGRLCVTSVVELARVLTPENRAEVLPLFFGCSSREAREVAASLDPRPDPPRRTVVTSLPVLTPPLEPAAGQALPVPPPGRPAVQSTEPPRAPSAAPRTEVRPLTAELRRLHVTVSDRFLEKVSAARDGLSHVLPGATTEQVLEAALDLLLEKQARSRALVGRPRAARPAATGGPTGARAVASAAAPPLPTAGAVSASAAAPGPGSGSGSDPSLAEAAAAAPSSPRSSAAGSASRPVSPGAGVSPGAPAAARGAASPRGAGSRRRRVPAAIEREVRRRDGGRCQYPLDAGGVCGSTWQVELDHVTPLALGGETSVANLRCACRAHNRRAAELALGEHARASVRSARAQGARGAPGGGRGEAGVRPGARRGEAGVRPG